MYTDILSDLIIAKILSVNTIYTEAGTKLRDMHRDRWAIVQKSEGETEYYMNGKVFVSNKTRMVILPNGTDYTWRCIKSGHYSIIEFESNKTYDDILSFNITEQLSAKILRTMKELEYKRTIRSPLCELECIKETYDILLKLAESAPKEYHPKSHTSKIKPATEFIAKHYDRQLSNNELAKICGISTVYFRKLFTDYFGISPINYIHNIRIEKAKEMLSIDYSSITDIAFSLGYSSIYDFSRTFKKYTGVSPKKYVDINQSNKHQ